MTIGCFKKGNLGLDSILIVVWIFVLAVVMVFAYGLYKDFNADIQADPDIDTQAKTTAGNLETNYAPVFDQMFAIFIAVLWIALIVTTYLIDTNPMFFIIVLIMIVITFIIGMELSNQFEEFADEDDLSAAAAGFPITTWIMSHILQILIAMVLSAAITLYAKQE